MAKNDQITIKDYISEIPNITQYQQRIEDVGLFKRSDLKPTHNLKTNFRSIRNYLGNVRKLSQIL